MKPLGMTVLIATLLAPSEPGAASRPPALVTVADTPLPGRLTHMGDGEPVVFDTAFPQGHGPSA